MILSSLVLSQYKDVTDGWTDEQTDMLHMPCRALA